MTAQHDIRLFLADVDGALVTKDKVLTEAAKAAVHELDHAGVAFAITSGRPPRGMTMLIEPLALRTALAGFDGGVLVNPDMTLVTGARLCGTPAWRGRVVTKERMMRRDSQPKPAVVRSPRTHHHRASGCRCNGRLRIR